MTSTGVNETLKSITANTSGSTRPTGVPPNSTELNGLNGIYITEENEMAVIFEEMKKHIKPISISFISILLLLFIIIVLLVLYISHLKKFIKFRAPTVLESRLLSEVKTRPRESTPMETQTKTVDENNDDEAMYDYPEFMPAQLNCDKNSKIVEVMEENELYALSSVGTKKQSMLDGCVYDTIDENLLKQNLSKQRSDLMKETDFSTPQSPQINSNETNSQIATKSCTAPEVEKSIAEGGDDDWYATIDEAALKLNTLQQNVNEIPPIKFSVTDDDVYACIDESALLNMSSAAVINNIPTDINRDENVTHCNEFEASHHVNAPKEACNNIQPQKVTDDDIYTAVDMNAKKLRKSIMDIEVEEDTKKIKNFVQTGVVCLLENGAVANDLKIENAEIGLPLNVKQNAVVKYLEDNRDSMYETIDESALKLELEKLEFFKENKTNSITSKCNESDIEDKPQIVENQSCVVSKNEILLQNDLAVGPLESETCEEAPLNNTRDINLMNLHSPIESVDECHESIEIADDESNADLSDITDDIVTAL